MLITEDGESDEQVVLVSQAGTVNRIKVRDISIQSRYARYTYISILIYCFRFAFAFFVLDATIMEM